MTKNRQMQLKTKSKINIFLPEYPKEKDCLIGENLGHPRKFWKGENTGFHTKKF